MRRLALFFALSAVTAVLAAGCGGGGGGSVSKGDVAFSDANSHSSMAYVRHGNAFQEKYTPTVVEAG